MADTLEIFDREYTNVNGIKASDNNNNVQSYINAGSVITYYTGTTDPAASLGSNGDIYLKVVS